MSLPPSPILLNRPIYRADDGKRVLAFCEFGQARSNNCGANSASTSAGIVDRRLDSFEDLLGDGVVSHRRSWSKPLPERTGRPRGGLDMVWPSQPGDRFWHRQQIRVVREDDHDVAVIPELGLDRAHCERYVNTLLSRCLVRVVAVPQGAKPRYHDPRVIRFPCLGLTANCVVSQQVVFVRREPSVHFHANKTTGVTSAACGSQQLAEPVRVEVTPLDWHTLQAEGSARRPIGVLPVDEDRDSDGLR